jgi:hypothetical protein
MKGADRLRGLIGASRRAVVFTGPGIRVLRKNDKAFLQGPLAQVLIKGNQFEGFWGLFRPYKGCGKLQRVVDKRGPFSNLWFKTEIRENLTAIAIAQHQK